MSNVLMINGTAHGHVNPTLPLAKELSKRGENVYYCSSGEFKDKIEATGARFMDCGESLAAYNRAYRPGGNHPFYTLLEYLLDQDIVMSDIVLDMLGDMRFDYIIHDAMLGGGWMVARKMGLPAVCVSSSFAAGRLPVPQDMLKPGVHPQLDGILRRLDEYRKHSGMGLDFMDVFFQKEGSNIVFTSRLFQPGGDAFDESFQFVGPSIDESREHGEPLPDGLDSDTLIYVSMGTINNNCIQFYKDCIEAFSGAAANVILSVGQKIDVRSLGAIPANIRVYGHVPQLAVLRKAKAFISHGGLNSVSEALYYGVPVAAIPQANDQPAVARRLVELGAGLELKPGEATPGRLREAVDALISHESYRSACRRIGESFRLAGGYSAAVDNVFEYKTKLGIR